MFFLGKAIPKSIKIRAEVLLRGLPEIFSSDFEKNKEAIKALQLPLTSWGRNLIAGYIARKLKEKTVAQ